VNTAHFFQDTKENILRENANFSEELVYMLRNIFGRRKACLGLGGWHFWTVIIK
jgi:hypothetical protein